MAEALMQSNMNDEKMYLVRKLLNEGKDKFEAARAVGYRGVDGLDRYAKSLGYAWNIAIKNYEPIDPASKAMTTNPPVRITKILSMVEKGVNLNDIAKYFKMKNSQELAGYMKSKGYVWDVENANYIRKSMISHADNELNEDSTIETENEYTQGSEIDIMKLLESNKGKLVELLSYNPQRTIPRYLLKGMPVTKGFFISVEIDRLIKDFSREKNVLQKDIIQTALIEFFQKYGFKQEVEAVLKS